MAIMGQRQENDEDQDQQADEVDEYTDETAPDDIEEAKSLSFYFRMDEGNGDHISDITDHKHKITIQGENIWSTNPLEESEPLDFEDKWGKVSSPNFSVELHKIEGQKLSIQDPGKLKVSKNFTLEFWFNLQSS